MKLLDDALDEMPLTAILRGLRPEVSNSVAEIHVAAGIRRLGLDWAPGVATPTEAFAALDHRASVLKLFPCKMIPATAIEAMRAVLPPEAVLVAVGSVTLDEMAALHQAGANGFGLGSGHFRVEFSLDEIVCRAADFAEAAKGIAPQ